jgi:hypothetical protein
MLPVQLGTDLQLVVVVVFAELLQSRYRDHVLSAPQSGKYGADSPVADHEISSVEERVELLARDVGHLPRPGASVCAGARLDDDLRVSEKPAFPGGVHGHKEPVERHLVGSDGHEDHSNSPRYSAPG